ncbi:MAG: inositol monophosphatase [Limnohabitans sp.]|jgi:myo-inositol-1(or 4)-monophosphatase|nr:inositol monophosphatase [Limnohabitans sp.]
MHPMLNVAVKAARRAATIINRASLNLERLQIDRKQHNDFVTEVDKAAEEAIIETLSEAYPNHGFLAEESGELLNNSDHIWIIDPLDGTTNFIHGFPQYAISIALSVNGVLQQAVIYDPNRDELFSASKGAGAYVDRRRLRVASQIKLENALIGTGFPYRQDQDVDQYLKIFAEMTRQCAGLRRPGAASLDLAYVAAGRYDGFFESELKPWDMAAGALIITEAGGLVGNYRGEEGFLESGEIMAGNPRIFAQMAQVLGKYSRQAT